MHLPRAAALALLLFSLPFSCLFAVEPETKPGTPPPVEAEKQPAAAPGAEAMPPAVEQLVREARNAIVVITVAGRDGKSHGLGSGFVVSSDGLIATNLHVIGEARPIAVEFADGKKFDVTSIHASDRKLDLALVKIDAKELTVLPLGDSAQVQQGQAVVALGNPQGLRYSVVSGVISGTRKVEEREMLQLAIPIEPGNSGGPVVDQRGNVLGVMTMKSAITENLGFAVPINNLKPLLEKPNPVPMSRWLTIGALDPREWKPLFGARWQQRAGRIFVGEPGEGFGGRSLCLSQAKPPELPYEIGVQVKLDKEEGAAGLIFNSDGDEKHYGFYPSAGKLRFTRFEGPNVYTWKVLWNEASEHYLPGQWNHFKVRLEKDRILCYVNDELVLESKDDVIPPGSVGLAKFRDTQAEFKQFRVGASIPSTRLAAETAQQLGAAIDKLPALDDLTPQQVEPLTVDAAGAGAVLRERAKALEAQAEQMRRLAADVHAQAVVKQLAEVSLKEKDDDIELCRGALLIARLDDEDIDVEQYLRLIERMTSEILAKLPPNASDTARREALNKHLFEDNGFHGSRTDFFNRANSYLNRVLDDREGLPITLAIVYLELGRRIGLNLEGVGLPGHFVARHVPAKGEPELIDVFEGGKTLTKLEAGAKVIELTGEPLEDADLATATNLAILRRILANLIRIAQDSGDREGMLRYLEAAVALDPASVSDRGMRAVLRHQTGRRAAAIDDLDWFLEHKPEGLDLERIREMKEFFLHGTAK